VPFATCWRRARRMRLGRAIARAAAFSRDAAPVAPAGVSFVVARVVRAFREVAEGMSQFRTSAGPG